jgi:hypothetical protein
VLVCVRVCAFVGLIPSCLPCGISGTQSGTKKKSHDNNYLIYIYINMHQQVNTHTQTHTNTHTHTHTHTHNINMIILNMISFSCHFSLVQHKHSSVTTRRVFVIRGSFSHCLSRDVKVLSWGGGGGGAESQQIT